VVQNIGKAVIVKKSECLKKYCECYQSGMPCTDICKCLDCKNGRTSTSKKSKGKTKRQQKKKTKGRGKKNLATRTITKMDSVTSIPSHPIGPAVTLPSNKRQKKLTSSLETESLLLNLTTHPHSSLPPLPSSSSSLPPSTAAAALSLLPTPESLLGGPTFLMNEAALANVILPLQLTSTPPTILHSIVGS